MGAGQQTPRGGRGQDERQVALGLQVAPAAAGRRGGRGPRAPTRSRRTPRRSRRAAGPLSPSPVKPVRTRAATSSMHAEHADDRRRVDRRSTGLVVEADVAAGDRDAEGLAGVRQAATASANCHMTSGSSGEPKLRQLVTASGARAGRGHVAVRLGQRELRAGVRVEAGVAAVAVGGQRDALVGLLGARHDLADPQHAGVVGHGQHGVAEHVPVVLGGHPLLVGEVRRAEQPQQRRAQVGGPRARRLGAVGLERDLVGGLVERPLVDRALVGGGARRDVDDGLAVPGHRAAGRCR